MFLNSGALEEQFGRHLRLIKELNTGEDLLVSHNS
jgi:hypothetical protein